jgi:hypothetical protein
MEGTAAFKANDFLWKEVERLREEKRLLQEQLRQHEDQSRRVMELQRCCAKLSKEKERLEKRVAELTQKLSKKPREPLPVFVKVNTKSKRRQKPGRKAGHAAALRPKAATIDVHQEVPLPIDTVGAVCCPECKTQLSEVRHHERVVEDVVPAKTITTCYRTTSGYCPCCRKRIESRADEQPPAWDLPHAQLGINALSLGAIMRVCYRLPLRQITGVFAAILGLKVCPAAIVKQLKRLSKWLEGQYHRLKLILRASGVVYGDETSWRTDGKNAVLWMLSNDQHTLYHVDKSRGGKVIAELLGEAFGAEGQSTLVSDFYSVYDQFDCPQQKCLAHLQREIKDLVAQRPGLAGHGFFKRAKRLIKAMLKLKAKREQLTPQAYEHQVQLLEKRLADLAKATWNDPDADRLGARLRKYNGKLTTFLHKPEVPGTNNTAERELRPAVVLRKITGGNRSAEGAKAWAILASVIRTIQRQGRDLLATIQTLLKAHWAGKDVFLLTDVLTPAPTNTS